MWTKYETTTYDSIKTYTPIYYIHWNSLDKHYIAGIYFLDEKRTWEKIGDSWRWREDNPEVKFVTKSHPGWWKFWGSSLNLILEYVV